MGIDPKLLKDQCTRTLERTSLRGIGERVEGKVRDNYVDASSGRRTICVTDRVSCFDVVVGTLPFKGQVLNQLAAFWFERTTAIAPNHLIAVPDPAVSIVRECRVIPVEFVVRGYLTGSSPTSIWRAYDAGERLYCGHRLRDGMHNRVRSDASARAVLGVRDYGLAAAYAVLKRPDVFGGAAVQSVALFPHLSVFDNLALLPTLEDWSNQQIEDRTDELLSLMELPADVTTRFPHHRRHPEVLPLPDSAPPSAEAEPLIPQIGTG